MNSAYCFGHISNGKLFRVKGMIPSRDGYGEIISVQRNFCGEALSTAIVLNRLGIKVSLAGNWLGDTDAGRQTREFIAAEGIDDSDVLSPSGYEGGEELVFSDGVSRIVFGRNESLLQTERQWEMPEEAKVAASDVVCADSSFGEATLTVLKYAVKHDKPFVASNVPFDSPCARHSVATICSASYLHRMYGGNGGVEAMKAVFEKYLLHTRGLVVFTFGALPLWYGRHERAELAPPSVKHVVDVAGAGDSFRAGMMYGVLNRMSDDDTLQFACRVAASVVQTSPGVLGFPDTRVCTTGDYHSSSLPGKNLFHPQQLW